MSLLRTEPEKSRSEILEADNVGELLGNGYSEFDLRRDWYLNALDSDPHYEMFEQNGVTGVQVGGDREYKIVGFPHGIEGTELTPDKHLEHLLDEFVLQESEGGAEIFYEQGLNGILSIDGEEMDDQSWAVETAKDRGLDYAEKKAEKAKKLDSYLYWAKTVPGLAGYATLASLGREELASNSSKIRDSDLFLNNISALQSGDLETAQEAMYRNQLPEKLERDLVGEFKQIRLNGRSERMAEYVFHEGNEHNVLLVGTGHMFPVAHYLEDEEFSGSFEETNLDFDKWLEEELEPKVKSALN